MGYLVVALAAGLLAASPETNFDRARALQAQGRYAEAERYYRSALKQDPRSAPALANLAVVVAKQGRYPDAIPLYESALKIDPNVAALKVNLAIAYFQTGDCGSAARWFEAALQGHPEDRRSRQLLGVCQLETGRFPDAVRSFEALMPSRDPSILLGVATAYVKVGRTEEGSRILDALIREHDDLPGVRVAVAMAQYGKQEYTAAAAGFQKALEADPDNPEARFYLGAVLFKQNDFEGAMREWGRAVQSKPSYFPAVFALGALLAERRQQDAEAKSLLRRASTLRPRHPGPYLELGKIAMHEEDYQAALGYLRTAVRLDPHSKTTSFLLATALQRAGRAAESRAEFERSRKLYSEDMPDLIRDATQAAGAKRGEAGP